MTKHASKFSLFFFSSLAIATFTSCGGGGDDSLNTKVLFEGYISHSIFIDVDNDNDLDLVLDHNPSNRPSVSLLINDGSGHFTERPGSLPDRPQGTNVNMISAGAGDFNNDGFTDLLVAMIPGDYSSVVIQLLTNDGTGHFFDDSSRIGSNSFDGGWLTSFRVADFDGDGQLDFGTLPSFGSSVPDGIFLQGNDGNFTFALDMDVLMNNQTADENVLAGGGDFWVGDLNNDGKPDIVTSEFANNVNTSGYRAWSNYINTSTPGNLSFTPVENFENDQNWSRKQVGTLADINGDNFLDLITSSAISGGSGITGVPLLIYLNDGNGGFLAESAQTFFDGEVPGFEHIGEIFAGDFDHNGNIDLYIPDGGYDAEPFPGKADWLILNNGTKLVDVTSTNLSTKKTFSHGPSIGDVNGDGYTDLFRGNSSYFGQFEIRLWINNGDGSFHASDQNI